MYPPPTAQRADHQTPMRFGALRRPICVLCAHETAWVYRQTALVHRRATRNGGSLRREPARHQGLALRKYVAGVTPVSRLKACTNALSES
jgi:hypothetical protein